MSQFIIVGLFYILELVAFILPAIPPDIYQRFAILATYFVIHSLCGQYYYSKWKRDIIAQFSHDTQQEH